MKKTPNSDFFRLGASALTFLEIFLLDLANGLCLSFANGELRIHIS
jgi:hypothetical protein